MRLNDLNDSESSETQCTYHMTHNMQVYAGIMPVGPAAVASSTLAPTKGTLDKQTKLYQLRCVTPCVGPKLTEFDCGWFW